MEIDAAGVINLIEAELHNLSDRRVIDHIRDLLVPPYVEYLDWDYGEPGEAYPCWVVLKHAPSKLNFLYCEHGFGPISPWGIDWSDTTLTIRRSMGQDGRWFSGFLETYFATGIPRELPIWRVFKITSESDGEPVSDEGAWEDICARAQLYRMSDVDSQYRCDNSIAIRCRE